MPSTKRQARAVLLILLALPFPALRAQDTVSTAIPCATTDSAAQRPPRGSMHGGELWPEDPSRTRLLFAHTGRTLRAREAYVAATYGIMPSMQVGLTDYLTVGAGETIVIGRESNSDILYVTSRVRLLSTPAFNLSAGGLTGVARNSTNSPRIRALYGAGTYGGDDASVTLGAGWGDGSSVMDRRAVVMLGASARVARDMAFVTENYFAASGRSGQLLSGGVRIISERIAVDLAAFLGGDWNAPLPYVSLLYRF